MSRKNLLAGILLTACAAALAWWGYRADAATGEPPLSFEAPGGASNEPNQCAFTWATQDLPELSDQVQTAIQEVQAGAEARAEAYGENCTFADGRADFSAMETDFTISFQVRSQNEIEEIVRGVAGALGCQADITMTQVTPALINDLRVAMRVQEAARRVLPDSQLDTASFTTMGAEDMAFFLEKVPGCYFFVGSANRDKGLDYGHHNPKFDLDENAVPRAAALMASAAADFLK
ncbi:MAG TPA: M20/M25/M40 family metallo-hydrolase [Anaerolineales bacterium]